MSTKHQRGISSITAIFLVTVLAVLAAAGIRMWRSAQDDQTLDMQLMRARNAAAAGLQTGFYRAARVGSCVAATTNINNLPGTLAPYTVTLTCVADGPYTDGGPVTRYRLQSVACNMPAAALAACPNNVASSGSGYVEVVASGECIVAGASSQCR